MFCPFLNQWYCGLGFALATHVKTFDFVVSTNVFEGSGFSHFGEAEKITYNEN